MAILVYAEHDNASLKKATLNTIAAAKQIGDDIHVLVAGSGAQAVADEAAKAEGDRLVLGLNSDESVRRLNKGPERPINPEHARAGVLMALKAIDAVVVFGDDTPLAIINALKPDVLVKGGDYDPNETDPSKKTYMVGSTEVRDLGGEVVAIPLVDGFSTTNIVRRMRD